MDCTRKGKAEPDVERATRPVALSRTLSLSLPLSCTGSSASTHTPTHSLIYRKEKSLTLRTQTRLGLIWVCPSHRMMG